MSNLLSSSVYFMVQPGGTLCGTVPIPGDKSISHRAIMLAALAEGTTHITGCLLGADVLATLRALRAMGVVTSDEFAAEDLRVQGVGMHGLQVPQQPLDLGNSGTSMRLLCG